MKLKLAFLLLLANINLKKKVNRKILIFINDKSMIKIIKFIITIELSF